MWFWKRKASKETVRVHAGLLSKYIQESIAHFQKEQEARIAAERKEREARIAAERKERERRAAANSDIRYSRRVADDPDIKYSRRDTVDVRSYMNWEKSQKTYKSFSKSVLENIEKRQITNKAFYRLAGIDRKLFSKLSTDFSYQPSKNTAIRCCLALHLNEIEAVELMKIAGYAFSDNNPLDLAIRYCIIHGIYDLDCVNGLLDEMEIRTL